jgi:quinol monooxygenase YgiN
MIVLLAQYQVRPGLGDKVQALLAEMAEMVRQHEPGCRTYEVSRGREDGDAFLLYEVYVDETAVSDHRATPHFQQYVLGSIIPLLASRTVSFYNIVIE